MDPIQELGPAVTRYMGAVGIGSLIGLGACAFLQGDDLSSKLRKGAILGAIFVPAAYLLVSYALER
ncbi:MAG: hypothetical protein HC945_03730 [Nitrosarchaeum sp.]|nr:hypothetical protein [Nitrosarchaeum sp.]